MPDASCRDGCGSADTEPPDSGVALLRVGDRERVLWSERLSSLSADVLGHSGSRTIRSDSERGKTG